MFDIPLHKLIVHFPIALGLFAFLYDGWAVYTKRPGLHDVGYGLSLWAAVAGVIAVVTGLQIAGLSDIGGGEVTGHALYGISNVVVFAAFGLWRYSARARLEGPDENYSLLWLAIQGLATLLVLAAAMTGHQLGM